MNITFSCPHCEAANCCEVSAGALELVCAACGKELNPPADAIIGGQVRRCLVCPSTDLFVRKDFPQRLGVMLVTIGLVASCVAWAYSQLYLTFAILFGTALVDVVLYLVVPNALMCYRCGSMYRGAAEIDAHGSFNLETHERHRQQKMRLAELKQRGVRTQESALDKSSESSNCPA
jgi:hypothetical protein